MKIYMTDIYIIFCLHYFCFIIIIIIIFPKKFFWVWVDSARVLVIPSHSKRSSQWEGQRLHPNMPHPFADSSSEEEGIRGTQVEKIEQM